MEPVSERPTADRPALADETALELLVHGVGGATPEEMLGDPRTVRVTGDEIAAVYRREDDVNAERHPEDYQDKPVPEAYVWSNLTSGNGSRALWLLLLPFMVVNLAHWMRPSARQRARTVRIYGLLVRFTGLTLTVVLVAAVCEVALDLVAWQCAGTRGCAQGHIWLHFLAPGIFRGGWWTQPGRRLAFAALVPTVLTALLWYLSHRTWSAYESQQPLPHRDPDEGAEARLPTALGRPGFWYGRRLVARLRAAHTAAGLLTVAAAVGTSAARYDRAPGGPETLDILGRALDALLVVGGLFVVWVVGRRGRSERRLDRELDRALVRWLPLNAFGLLVLALVYAGWSRPGWHSAGRLPGDATFGGIALVQCVLVVALAVVACLLYRSMSGTRAVLHGLGGPAVAMLACALGGVMTGGVAQRVGDWVDGAGGTGTGGTIDGPPVLLTWQASVLPPLLVVLLVLAGWLGVRTSARTRRGLAQVRADYADDVDDKRDDAARTQQIAGTRARAVLTDRAPLAAGITSAATLLLGAGALAGSWSTGKVPSEAVKGTYPLESLVEGAAQAAQALGSWLIGFGFILFVTWGRRAYKDVSARRTIGILWDVGTFWPRAAHPFAPPCYAERAVPDLTWRMATWTRDTGGRLVLSGHSQGSVLAAAAAWQLRPEMRGRVALLTYGSPLERLYGRWFPAYFGPEALSGLHREVVCWRNLFRPTDPIGGPVLLPGEAAPRVDAHPFKDPLAYGRTDLHPLPAPILGHSDYQADPAFDKERGWLLARLRPGVPAQRPGADGEGADADAGAAPAVDVADVADGPHRQPPDALQD